MERLSGMDAAFLYMETPSATMHVVGTILLDPSTMPEGYSFERIRDLIASRLHRLAPFRRRVVEVPFGLEHPLWIEDPNFDLESHLYRVALPEPGSQRELADLVGRVAGRPLDRSRPLWELWAVEGLENGRVALITKMHHAAIDGVSGADLMLHLFDLDPHAPADEAPRKPWSPEPLPPQAKLVGEALLSRATQPVHFARLLARTGRKALDVARTAFGSGSEPRRPALPFTAPRTAFNRAITPHRAVAFGRASLADVKRIKSAFGTTVNDVVLAACTMSLRRYLQARAELPDVPLVATVPVSARTPGERGQSGNRVSAMFVRLPVHRADPVEQLLSVRDETKDAKRIHHAIGADLLRDWVQFASPTLFSRAARLYSSMKLAERHRPIHNLVISNVPGPPVPLYTAGARVQAVYPFGPVLEGAAINITVLSYLDSMDFGVIACRELVPHHWDLARGFGEAVAELRDVAESRTRSPSGRSRGPAWTGVKSPRERADAPP